VEDHPNEGSEAFSKLRFMKSCLSDCWQYTFGIAAQYVIMSYVNYCNLNLEAYYKRQMDFCYPADFIVFATY